jgi:hypothetical protein
MKGQTHGGKGSAQRKTDSTKFANNYDAIFSKSKKQETQKKKESKK